MALRIDAGDTVLILGHRGSGKSTLANEIARRWPRVLVFDPKHEPAAILPNMVVADRLEVALAALPGRVVWRPAPWENDDLPGRFDQLVRRVVLTGGAHGILVHELADVSPHTGSASWLAGIYRTNRTRRIPLLLCSQRPRRIDVLAVSESTHRVLFRLDFPADWEFATELMGAAKGALSRDLPSYGAYHRGPDGVIRRLAPVAVTAGEALPTR